MSAAPPTSTTTSTAARRPSTTAGSMSRSRAATSRRRSIAGTVTTGRPGVVPPPAEGGLPLGGEPRTAPAADDVRPPRAEDRGMALPVDTDTDTDTNPVPDVHRAHLHPTGGAGRARNRSALVPVLALAVGKLAFQLSVAGRYGWHRDELYYVDAGRHPALGYVDFPAVTPLLSRVATALFGDSLVGLRSLS